MHTPTQQRIIIYQALVRLFGNSTVAPRTGGSLSENGCGKMDSFTDCALESIRSLGATHIWYTGIIAHASQTDYTAYGIPLNHPCVVKGVAGSPYAIRDYYDVDPDLAVRPDCRLDEFRRLVERTHRHNLGVIIDFVPNHVARQYHSAARPDGVADLGEADDPTCAFSPSNNFYYIPGTPLGGSIPLYDERQGLYVENPAKATGNDRFDAAPNASDWYETVKLNYGIDYCGGTGTHYDPVPDTWYKMSDILHYWASFGIDGFRCDMAEMVPCEFWQWVIPRIRRTYPRLVFIAEVYNPASYRDYLFRGHFDYLYDKVGLYDTLRSIVCGHAPASSLTPCWQAIDDIRPHMLHFLENHDEQRIASDYFAGDPRRALPAAIVAACLHTGPFMLYFGQELGEPGMDTEGFSGRDGRTTIFDYWSVDTLRRWMNHGRYTTHLLTPAEQSLRAFYSRLLALCNSEASLREGHFFDLMYVNSDGWQFDARHHFAFLRSCGREALLVAVNFGSQDSAVQIRLPQHAFDCLQMPPQDTVQAVELLGGTTHSLPFKPSCPLPVTLPGWGGVILKITW